MGRSNRMLRKMEYTFSECIVKTDDTVNMRIRTENNQIGVDPVFTATSCDQVDAILYRSVYGNRFISDLVHSDEFVDCPKNYRRFYETLAECFKISDIRMEMNNMTATFKINNTNAILAKLNRAAEAYIPRYLELGWVREKVTKFYVSIITSILATVRSIVMGTHIQRYGSTTISYQLTEQVLRQICNIALYNVMHIDEMEVHCAKLIKSYVELVLAGLDECDSYVTLIRDEITTKLFCASR